MLRGPYTSAGDDRRDDGLSCAHWSTFWRSDEQRALYDFLTGARHALWWLVPRVTVDSVEGALFVVVNASREAVSWREELTTERGGRGVS